MPSANPANDVQICSQALLRLGAKAIGSFDDVTDRASLCSNIYPTKKDQILSIHDWKFTLQKKQLQRKADAPVSGSSFEYAMPNDRLTESIITMYNTGSAGAPPFKDFEIQGDGVLTDATELFADYQSNGSQEASWPPYFVELIIKAMMVELAMPITDQANMRISLFSEVYGTPVEFGRGGMVGQCVGRNSREDPPRVFTDFSLTLARAEGQ